MGAAAAKQSTTFAWVGAVAAVAVLATPGLAGHAGTTSPVALNLCDGRDPPRRSSGVGGRFDSAGLRCLPRIARVERGGSHRVHGGVVGRFSSLALVAVAAIVVTGSYRTWMEIDGFDGFLGATYGHVLLVKLIAFVPLLTLGFINNRWMLPRIRKAAEEPEKAASATRGLKRLVGAEVALALVVLALTALLVNLPPSRVAADGNEGPFLKDVALGDYELDVLINPNKVGTNDMHFTATENSQPVKVKEMTVLFRMPEEDIGPLRAKGRKLAPGHFVVEGPQLSLQGVWQLEIVARTSAFDEERATVSVEVNE